MPHHISQRHKSLRKTHKKSKKPTMSNKGYTIVKRIRHKGKPAPMHNVNYAIRASLIPANNMKENESVMESMAMNQNVRRSSRAASAAASQKMSKQSKKPKRNTQKKWKGVRYNYYNISSKQRVPRESIYYHFPASSSAASASASNLNFLNKFASMSVK